MKAFANIKSRYAEYKALDSADKAKAWKEGLIDLSSDHYRSYLHLHTEQQIPERGIYC